MINKTDDAAVAAPAARSRESSSGKDAESDLGIGINSQETKVRMPCRQYYIFVSKRVQESVERCFVTQINYFWTLPLLML